MKRTMNQKHFFAPTAWRLGGASLRRAAITLLLAVLTTATAWAQTTETVSYIDADGTQKSVTATVLTGDITQSGFELNAYGKPLMPAGWYVVKNSNADGVDASCTKEIKTTGDQGTIHIILADGAEMTVNGGYDYGFNLDTGYPLAIYGQSAGTGRLTVSSSSRAIYSSDDITINGGIVSATSSCYGAIYSSSVTINGGQVTATGGENKVGIHGTTTLGCRKLTDFIKSNGFNGSVTIKSGQTLYDGATAYSGTFYAGHTMTLRPFSSDDLAVNDDNTEYTIKTATGWGLFCDMLAQSDKGVFSGKTVLLGNDIEVSRMAGSQYHDFCGTFDGQGNTLTFNYSGSDTERIGPFSYISNVNSVAATIRRLNVVADITSSGQKVGGIVGEAWGTLTIEHCTVSGTITTSKQFAGGIIGSASNTPLNITDCHSSVTISSSISGDGTHGGFAGRVPSSATLNISGCLFDGKIITTGGTNDCGGFVGHSENTAGNNVTITNSLYDPADIDDGETEALTGNVENDPSCTFARNVIAENITNCYYTRLLGTAQGKQALSATASPVGDATQTYNVSGITAYAKGITRTVGSDATFYYGQGDEVAVSYTLPDGTTAPEPATATVLGGNAEGGADLAAGTYVVCGNITYNGPLNLDGDATLILADGATMNIGSDGDERINGHGIKGYDFDRDTGYNLTITSQTAGTGAVNVYVTGAENWAIGGKKLTINGGNITADTDGNSGNAIAAVSNLTINGGNVTANASGNDAQAIASASDITINGGTVNATGDLAGIAATSNVTINGGNVNTTATANADSYGIATNGTITLGWTRATDRIYANSYGGTVSVATADGHKLYDGNGNFLSGTVSDLAAVNGKTLQPALSTAYITAEGTTDTADAILLDASDTSLPAGNYLATGTLNYTQTGLTLSGNATLILADNCHMNVGTSGERISDYGIFGFSGGSHSITITSQSLGDDMGALSVYTTGMNKFGILANAITIDGGNVTADTDGRAAVALYAGGTDLTINGGTVTATTAGTDAHAIYAIGDFKYNGGDVTATATAANANAIYAYGNYNFSWRTPADRITIGATGLYAPDDDKTATFARLFTDATNIYSGTLTGDDLSTLAGKHLYPFIETLDLAARQAPDENYWTTFYCGHTDYRIDDDENACAYTATYADGKLTLHNQGKQIPKNTAVIIVADNDVVSMTAAADLTPVAPADNDLRGVNVDTPVANITSDLGEGTLYVLGMTTVDNEQHFGFHRYTGEEMAARKAFLHVPGSSNARALDMVFGDITGIAEMRNEEGEMRNGNEEMRNAWYTLDGRKLNGKPTKPGLYINNGRKVVIK